MSKAQTKEKNGKFEREYEEHVAKKDSKQEDAYMPPKPEGSRSLDAVANAVNLGISENLARELIHRNSANAEALLSLRS